MRLILLILVMVTLALPAWAADTSNTATSLHAFTPPPGDVSMDFLHQIFGTASDGVGVGGIGTMIGALMGVFSSAVLLLGMFFVMFTTVKGTIDSANDGVLLGKKMSSTWVPIRTVAGSAFMIPLASGYSLLQLIVLWLATQGAGIASTGWQVAMDQFAQTGTLGSVSVPDARPLAASVFKAEICMAAMNAQYAAENRAERIEAVQPDPLPPQASIYYDSAIQILSTFHTSVEYRWQSTTRPGPPACGSLAWEQSQQNKLTGNITDAPRTQIMQAQATAVAAMIKELRPAAEQIVSLHKRPAPGVIDRAALNYSNAIAAAAKAAADASPDLAREAFIKQAQTGGWIQSGTWFNNMIRLNDTIQAAANVIPLAHAVRIEDVEVNDTLVGFRDAMALADEYLIDRSASPHKAYEESIQDAKSLRSSDDVWRLLSVPAMSALDGITQQIAGANTSPLMQLRDIGNSIISSGFILKAGMFTLAGAAGSRASDFTVGNVFNLSDALKTTTSTVEWLSAALWGLGALLAVYLPAIPTILWATSVIRWLASVAETVLSAPLMASFILHPDGDDTVGRAGPGMMLILAMTMQPILLVSGFVVSALMTYPASHLVNILFIGMVSGATEGTMVGPISLLAWCSVYVAMQVLAMQTCFSLVQAVPDNVLKAVGGQAGAQDLGHQQSQEGIGDLKSGASGAGVAAAKPSTSSHPDSPNAKPGASKEGGNGFSNAELM